MVLASRGRSMVPPNDIIEILSDDDKKVPEQEVIEISSDDDKPSGFTRVLPKKRKPTPASRVREESKKKKKRNRKKKRKTLNKRAREMLRASSTSDLEIVDMTQLPDIVAQRPTLLAAEALKTLRPSSSASSLAEKHRSNTSALDRRMSSSSQSDMPHTKTNAKPKPPSFDAGQRLQSAGSSSNGIERGGDSSSSKGNRAQSSSSGVISSDNPSSSKGNRAQSSSDGVFRANKPSSSKGNRTQSSSNGVISSDKSISSKGNRAHSSSGGVVRANNFSSSKGNRFQPSLNGVVSANKSSSSEGNRTQSSVNGVISANKSDSSKGNRAKSLSNGIVSGDKPGSSKGIRSESSLSSSKLSSANGGSQSGKSSSAKPNHPQSSSSSMKPSSSSIPHSKPVLNQPSIATPRLKPTPISQGREMPMESSRPSSSAEESAVMPRDSLAASPKPQLPLPSSMPLFKTITKITSKSSHVARTDSKEHPGAGVLSPRSPFVGSKRSQALRKAVVPAEIPRMRLSSSLSFNSISPVQFHLDASGGLPSPNQAAPALLSGDSIMKSRQPSLQAISSRHVHTAPEAQPSKDSKSLSRSFSVTQSNVADVVLSAKTLPLTSELSSLVGSKELSRTLVRNSIKPIGSNGNTSASSAASKKGPTAAEGGRPRGTNMKALSGSSTPLARNDISKKPSPPVDSLTSSKSASSKPKETPKLESFKSWKKSLSPKLVQTPTPIFQTPSDSCKMIPGPRFEIPMSAKPVSTESGSKAAAIKPVPQRHSSIRGLQTLSNATKSIAISSCLSNEDEIVFLGSQPGPDEISIGSLGINNVPLANPKKQSLSSPSSSGSAIRKRKLEQGPSAASDDLHPKSMLKKPAIQPMRKIQKAPASSSNISFPAALSSERKRSTVDRVTLNPVRSPRPRPPSPLIPRSDASPSVKEAPSPSVRANRSMKKEGREACQLILSELGKSSRSQSACPWSPIPVASPDPDLTSLWVYSSNASLVAEESDDNRVYFGVAVVRSQKLVIFCGQGPIRNSNGSSEVECPGLLRRRQQLRQSTMRLKWPDSLLSFDPCGEVAEIGRLSNLPSFGFTCVANFVTSSSAENISETAGAIAACLKQLQVEHTASCRLKDRPLWIKGDPKPDAMEEIKWCPYCDTRDFYSDANFSRLLHKKLFGQMMDHLRGHRTDMIQRSGLVRAEIVGMSLKKQLRIRDAAERLHVVNSGSSLV